MAGQHVARNSLQRDSERPLCEAIKVRPGLQGRSQDVGDLKLRDICQGELHTASLTSPTERHMLHPIFSPFVDFILFYFTYFLVK